MKPLAVRRAEATARAAAWAALTPEQKLSSLDARGVAAQSQRQKLRKAHATHLIAQSLQLIPAADVPKLEAVILARDERPRHKKGKRGDGRRSR